jgi:hypothetical protein
VLWNLLPPFLNAWRVKDDANCERLAEDEANVLKIGRAVRNMLEGGIFAVMID